MTSSASTLGQEWPRWLQSDSQESLLPKAPSEVGGDERGAQKVGNRSGVLVEPVVRREPMHYLRRRLVAAQKQPT